MITFGRVIAKDEQAETVDLEIQDGAKTTIFRGVPSREFVRAGGLVVGVLEGGAHGRRFLPLEGAGAEPVVRRAIIQSGASNPDGTAQYECVFASGGPVPASWVAETGEVVTVYHLIAGTYGGLYASGVDVAGADPFRPVRLADGTRILIQRVDGAWYVQATQALDGECPPSGG